MEIVYQDKGLVTLLEYQFSVLEVFLISSPIILSNQVSSTIPNLEDTVTKTFDVGLRFYGSTEKQKLQNRFTAYNIVKQLQYHAYDKLTDDTINKADSHLRDNPKLSGIQGSAKLRKHLGDCSNLGETSYLSLLGALKGIHKVERKLTCFLDLSKVHPQAFIEWLLLERSPYLERLFQDRIHSSLDYARNILIGARRNIDQYLPESIQIDAVLPELTNETWFNAIDHTVQDIKLKLEDSRKNSETNNDTQRKIMKFLNKLQVIQTYRQDLNLFFREWVYDWNNPRPTTPKSRWKHLSQLSSSIETFLTENTPNFFKRYSLRSAVRTIVMTAYQPFYQDGWSVNQLVDEVLDPARMVSLPFMNKNKESRYKRRLPIQLIMGSKYVIERAGNSAILTTQALTTGKTSLNIYPVRKKRLGIKTDVLFHKSIRYYLDQGAKINSLTVSTKSGPSCKLRVQVTISGAYWMFLSKQQVLRYVEEFSQHHISFSAEFLNGQGIGLDVNKIGKDMLAFSEPYQLTNDIIRVQKAYFKLEKPIKDLGKALTRAQDWFQYYPSVFSKRHWLKTKIELETTHSRRKRLLKKIHNLSRTFVTAVLVDSKTSLFSIEDLRLSANGVKGALAKAILSMPDEVELFDNAVACAQWILEQSIVLERVWPGHTSQAKHLECVDTPAGRLRRDSKDYNKGTCTSCGQIENIHDHASRVIRNRGYKRTIPNPDIKI